MNWKGLERKQLRLNFSYNPKVHLQELWNAARKLRTAVYGLRYEIGIPRKRSKRDSFRIASFG
jgi:hypothetical protein